MGSIRKILESHGELAATRGVSAALYMKNIYGLELLREWFNKKTKKKIWIYPYLGGWVSQDGNNIHKKTNKIRDLFKVKLYTIRS